MAKGVVEDCKKIEMWWLKKHGYLIGYKRGGIQWTGGWNGSKSDIGLSMDIDAMTIHFQYTQTDFATGKKDELDYKFNLTTTPCNYGGVRYWFICGLSKDGNYCGRRVGVLYKPTGYKWFGCRHCFNLSYTDRQCSTGGRYGLLFKSINLNIKSDKLREKMKRWYWRGLPTKKHRRILRYDRLMEAYLPFIQ